MRSTSLIVVAMLLSMAGQSQSLKEVNLGSLYTYNIMDISTIDYTDSSKFVLYQVTESSMSPLQKSGIIRLDKNNTPVFNKWYSKGSVSFHSTRLFSEAGDGYLYALSLHDSSNISVLRIDPSNGNVVTAYKFLCTTRNLGASDFKVVQGPKGVGTVIFVLASYRIGTVITPVIIRFRESSGSVLTKELWNASNMIRPNQLIAAYDGLSDIGFMISAGSTTTHHIDYNYWQAGLNVTKLIYKDPLNTTYSTVNHQFGLTGNYLFFQGQSFGNGAGHLFFSRFDGPGALSLAVYRGFHQPNFSFEPFGHDINGYLKSGNPKFFGSYYDGTNRGWVLGEFDNSLTLQKSYRYTLRAYDPILYNSYGPRSLHADFTNSFGTSPQFAAQKPDATGMSWNNTMYAWTDWETNCKVDLSLPTENSSLTLEADYGFEIFNGPTVTVQNTLISTETVSASSSTICTDYRVAQPAIIKPELVNEEAKDLVAVFNNGEITVRTSKPMQSVTLLNSDGRLVDQRSANNSYTINLSARASTPMVVVRVTYADGSTGVKKLMAR